MPVSRTSATIPVARVVYHRSWEEEAIIADRALPAPHRTELPPETTVGTFWVGAGVDAGGLIEVAPLPEPEELLDPEVPLDPEVVLDPDVPLDPEVVLEVPPALVALELPVPDEMELDFPGSW